MRRSILCKLLQRQTYDILSQKHLFVLSLVGLILFGASAFRLLQVAIEWSERKYAGTFGTFGDNISGDDYRDRLCQHLPVDAVYTWVNGSDPELLRNLSLLRQQLLSQSNESSAANCRHRNCVPSPVLMLKGHNASAEVLASTAAKLGASLRKYTVGKVQHDALVFESLRAGSAVAERGWLLIEGQNATFQKMFVTSDVAVSNAVPMQDAVMVLGIPGGTSEQTLVGQLARATGLANISRVYMYENESLALVLTSGKLASSALLDYNLTLAHGRRASVVPAALVPAATSENEDVDASRFADNDELKYSLRSLQKYAPWIRKVFIITNGQIPSWLNLDYPKVSIVTHEEIFPNRDHLPTFSSPAIETHLHRIPGLSRRFIYLNDDVMFGKQVWPEDFYTQSHGYKVRLAWSVPDCAVGCPTSWIRDGYCDRPCNNSRCQWDGGDCLGEAGRMATHRSHGLFAIPQADVQKMYCSTSCANSWLADRYCDQACNVLECAFDAGDCGTSNYNLFHGVMLHKDVRDYVVPAGRPHAYVNLTMLMEEEDVKVTEGHYEENEAVRTVAVTLQHAVLTIVLRSRQNGTQVRITLKGTRKGLAFEFPFTVTINSSVPGEHLVEQSSLSPTIPGTTTVEAPLAFEEFAESERYPAKPHAAPPDREVLRYTNVDVEKSSLPDDLQQQLEEAWSRYMSGSITLRGFEKRKSRLIEEFVTNSTRGDLSPIHFVTKEGLPGSDHTRPHLFTSRHLLGVDYGRFPWERRDFFPQKTQESANSNVRRGRRLLDTFGDSLRHVNQLYNEAFGYEARKVPSHMAHMVDRDVVVRLQNRFPEEFDRTSSHKIRSPDDMQFAFSYFYFLMSEKVELQVEEIFDKFDVDASGTWSDREIRTVLTNLHDLPLEYGNVQKMESLLLECNKNFTHRDDVPTRPYEHYVDSVLPTITKELVASCTPLVEMLKKTFKTKQVNPFETIKEDDYAFKMIRNNVSLVLAQMDELRRDPKKFICLNDNIDHSEKNAEMVKAVVRDLYESLFPVPSRFELPPEYRNRFSYMRDLRAWQSRRNTVHAIICVCFVFLLTFTLVALCRSLRSSRRRVDNENLVRSRVPLTASQCGV